MKKIFLMLPLLFLFIACKDIFEEDISEARVCIVSPQNGVFASPGEIAFAWRAVENATGYHLTIVSPTFEESSRLVADSTLRPDSVFSGLHYEVFMEAGQYQWSIRAFNSGYSTREEIYTLFVQE